MVRQRKFLGEQWLGNKKLDKAIGWVKYIVLSAALEYIILANNISFDRFFFFEFMTIIQVFLKGLGELTFNPLNGWILNF